MDKNLVLIKQLENKNYGELYMRAKCNAISEQLFNKKIIYGIDYFLSADNYDGVVVINCRYCQEKTQLAFSELIQTPNAAEKIEKAIFQMACAKQSDLTEVNIDKLKQIIHKHDSTEWKKLEELTNTAPITYGAWERKVPFLGFSNEKSNNFYNFDIFYTLDQPIFELKPLTVAIIKSIDDTIYSILNFKNHTLACFLHNHFWAEYQYENKSNLVGLQQPITIYKDASLKKRETKEKLAKELSFIISELNKIDFVDKFFEKTKEFGTELDYHTMFLASGQIIGEKYWQNIKRGNVENIYNDVIRNIEVKFQQQ